MKEVINMQKNKKQIQLKLLESYSISLEDLDCDDFAILKHFKEDVKKGLTDPRQQYKIEYKIWDIICTVFVAVISNCNEWDEIEIFAKKKYKFLRNFLQLTGGIASSQTYERVFSLINPNELETICTSFIIKVLQPFLKKHGRDIINADGKIDRGSARNKTIENAESKPLNVLNFYSNNYGMCISSTMIGDKTNEIPTIENVLPTLNVEGAIITWDALNTQKANIKTVIASHADYVVALKGNHGVFHEEISLYFDEKQLEIIKTSGTKNSYLIEREKSHSQIVTYEYYQTEDIDWFDEKEDWERLHSIGCVKKTIQKVDGEITTEIRYYISSLFNDIYVFRDAIRMHWSVENKLHWHLDFTFKQDHNTTKNKKALFNLQIIKKLALALLTDVKPIYNMSLQKIRLSISLDFENEFLRFLNILSRNNTVFSKKKAIKPI